VPLYAQDNLQRQAGIGNRFEIIYVDFDALQRVPKLSAGWFRRAAHHQDRLTERLGQSAEGAFS
jgi:beta-glucosidase/6-phospho-beta-glucosidase/beta-galactosidase